jgi:hypothetical protein
VTHGELEVLVNLVGGTTGTVSDETERLVSVLVPSGGAVSLDGHDGGTVGQDRESVLLVLSVEDLETRSRDDSGLDALLLQLLGGIGGEVDLGTSRDQGDVGCFLTCAGGSKLVNMRREVRVAIVFNSPFSTSSRT